MVFSNLIFLYFFLPLVIIVYFICKNRVYRNTVLLLFSLLFYSWGEPKYIFLMILASFIAYIGGILIGKYEKQKHLKLKKLVYIITIMLLVANLFVFKYFNFVFDNLSGLFSKGFSVSAIVLPIGISFYTFQIISYVIDLYRGEISVQRNFFYLTLYVSFFPQLIAGPIVRYKTVEQEICCRNETLDDVVIGLKRFIIGLAKKVIIANNVSKIAVIVYAGNASDYGTTLYWIAAIAYTFQIYFDFSGYSDMAIGLGRIFGFHFLENFNYPYVSLSITDFWRRWHISLSTWFRDYIYIPLGGNRTSTIRWIFNILIVWALTGLWHGANWNFVIWGLYYAALLLIEKLFLNKIIDKMPRIIKWLYAFFFVNIGWVIFNLTDFNKMTAALQTMFTLSPTNWMNVISANSSILNAIMYLPIAFLFAFPVFKNLNSKIKENNFIIIIKNIGYLIVFGLCITYILSSSYNPFIYFRF